MTSPTPPRHRRPRPRRQPPATPGAQTRAAALDLLLAVLRDGTALDAALDAAEADLAALSPSDRGFVRALVSTTLRRLGRLDAVIAAYVTRPLPASGLAAQMVLRLGAAQLLVMGTPAHAAVGATVGAAKVHREARTFDKLINAVLRRIAENGAPVFAALPASRDWPDWLVDSWRAAYGPERAEMIAAASGDEAPLDLTIKAGDSAVWAERLGGRAVGADSVRLTGAGAIRALPGYQDGAWWVQDAAAALPARLLGDVRGRRVLDLCAAPGGKTMQLAAAGAAVVAVDQSEVRAKRLQRNLLRTGLNAQIEVRDGRDLSGLGPFDAVLVDAPCTATGTLRRRPDVAWARQPGDGALLAPLQSALLSAAADAVKPGGRIVFCTCSLQPEEGAPVAADVLSKRPDLAVLAITQDALPDGVVPQSDGSVRTLPCDWLDAGGLDGFFIARLIKRP